ncbi:MAG: hemolysin III family protein [Spirochaetota bacterium]
MKSRRLSKEEWFNTISHGFAAFLSFLGFGLMLYFSLRDYSFPKLSGSILYGFSLCFAFTSSAIYHSRKKGRTKDIFQRLDHIGIFLLIAGTYTTYILNRFSSERGYVVLSIVWGMSLVGITIKAFTAKRFTNLSTIFYILIACVIFFEIELLFKTLSWSCLIWLWSGGLLYLIGVYFYIKDNKYMYHSIWHLFVILGALFHYISVVVYVI